MLVMKRERPPSCYYFDNGTDDFLDHQQHVSAHVRRVTAYWMIEVVHELHLNTNATFLSILLFDAFVARANYTIPRAQVQLIGCTCVLIASKLCSIDTMHLDDARELCVNQYTLREHLDMERTIVQTLDYQLFGQYVPMNEIVQHYVLTPEQRHTVHYLLLLALISYYEQLMLTYPCQLLARALAQWVLAGFAWEPGPSLEIQKHMHQLLQKGLPKEDVLKAPRLLTEWLAMG